MTPGNEVLVQGQMLAHKKPEVALRYLESYPSRGPSLPPLLSAFAVELYRRHKPAIDCAMSAHAKKRYNLLADFVWGFVHDNESVRQEVVRKWMS